MDSTAAYREAGALRGAAEIAGHAGSHRNFRRLVAAA